MLMRKVVSFLFLMGWFMSGLFGELRAQQFPAPVNPPVSTAELATLWADMSLDVIRRSPGNTPTYASRSLAYLGVTMYECVVRSNPAYRSLAGQVNGLRELPQPEPGQAYNWLLVMNAGQAVMLDKLYPHAYRSTSHRIDSLQTAVVAALSVTEKADVVERSVMYGWTLAKAIFEWSKTDGGYEGYSRNFDADCPIPTGESYWIPPVKGSGQSTSQLPLHPAWGNNRPFIARNGQLPLPVPPDYSVDSSSVCYKEYEAVYRKNTTLTDEEKAIALWWADDPTHTAAPPGHSYNVATIAIKKAQPDLVKAAQTYACIGMAVADAFINCWRCKYQYYRERPSTFIAATIEKGWKPFWAEPPFPAFSSGHSTQAAAAATVLTSLYGDRFTLTDSTHAGHGPDLITGVAFKPRSFSSFWEMAVECADSRFYGGIHTPFDNEVGLVEGQKIGSNVNALIWRK